MKSFEHKASELNRLLSVASATRHTCRCTATDEDNARTRKDRESSSSKKSKRRIIQRWRRKRERQKNQGNFPSVQRNPTSFNNTISRLRRQRQCDCRGRVPAARIQGLPEGHTVCRSDGFRDGCHEGHGNGPQADRSVCQGTRLPAGNRDRALQATGRNHMIKDVTPVPHNGCRPPKRRRV